MKEIELTQGQITLVDDEDFERVNQLKWYAQWSPKTNSFYAARKHKNKKMISMACFIMNCSNNITTDHRDHNTLNNQKQNLRVCTSQENSQNRRKRSSCTSKYKGVYWQKQVEQWIAQIRTEDVFGQSMKIHLGCFKIEEEAALAYDKAASEEFGEFAYLNFP